MGAFSSSVTAMTVGCRALPGSAVPLERLRLVVPPMATVPPPETLAASSAPVPLTDRVAPSPTVTGPTALAPCRTSVTDAPAPMRRSPLVKVPANVSLTLTPSATMIFPEVPPSLTTR